MASLFGKKKLHELAKQINTKDVIEYIDIVKSWHNDYRHGSLKTDKETSREQQYNSDFFLTILGYKEKPTGIYTFEPKATTVTGQLPDAVIGYTDISKKIENISAVVELKGASVPLDRPQRREGNMSPIQQGFKYKTQYRNCPFVIVSNFWEFRLYNDTQLDYELWTLDDLVNPADDYLLFKSWYVLLRSENFIAPKGTSKTENILSDIRIEQLEISKKYYRHYKEVRIELLRNIYKNNINLRRNFDVGIELGQKIIDRVVFICFAEDSDLLPENTLQRLLEQSQANYGSLWNSLKGLFEGVDRGGNKLEIKDGYDGGLFRPDTKLDSLIIKDEVLESLIELSQYDYKEELSVNVLGHIFEQSISDLEEIKSKIDKGEGIESIAHLRRKKEGIFYTPDYIVRYIVENSLGAYLREEEARLKKEYKLHGDINDKNYQKREKKAYGKYQDFLQNVKVVDPACGSGAFLVYVFDYLLAENKRVDDILEGTLLSLEGYVRHILQNNIYGVDINEESVEITKLSLWLKSAQKGKKLTALGNNIKCGNSLIDDEKVAGKKAFNWHKKFAEIFKNGGFDVVVGNPPYVNARTMSTIDRRYLKSAYPELQGSYDLYVGFLLKALNILSPSGRYGWIIPNKLLASDYAKKTLDRLNSTSLEIIINISKISVFDGVGVYPIIILGNKSRKSIDVKKYRVSHPNDFNTLYHKEELENSFKRFKTLADFGIKTNSGTTGFEAQKMKAFLNENNKGIPFAVSGNVDPYTLDTSLVPYMKSRYVNPHIIDNSQEIADSKYRFWKAEKIIIAGMTKRIEAVFIPSQLALGVGIYGVYDFGGFNPKALTAILNSKFMTYYLLKEFPDKHLAGGYLAINRSTIDQLPLVDISEDVSDQLANSADNMFKIKKELVLATNRFISLISMELNLEKWPTKLNKWWSLDFSDFVKALKVDISLTQKDELLGLFEKYKAQCSEIDAKIQKTDHEIDQLVYKLYKLTQEEIAIVEESTK